MSDVLPDDSELTPIDDALPPDEELTPIEEPADPVPAAAAAWRARASSAAPVAPR